MSEKQPINPDAKTEFKTERMGLSTFIRRLYPKCHGNSVAEMITTLTSNLEPILQKNPLNLHHDEGGLSQESHLAVRGSSIKRHQLGTPPGYWKVSEFYQSVNAEESDPLTKQVVRGLTTGPNDIDILFQPRPGLTAKDVYEGVIESLEGQGFYFADDRQSNHAELVKYGRRVYGRYQDYNVSVDYREIGGLNAMPVKAVVVDFHHAGKQVLKVDLIKAPVEEESTDNFRMSGSGALADWFTFGYISKSKDGRNLITIENDLGDILSSPHFFKLFYLTNPSVFLNSYAGRLRALYQRTMWFNNFRKERREFGDYDIHGMINQIRLAHLDQYPITRERWMRNLSEPNQYSKLEARVADIVSGFMVGLTYDPFLFMKLAFEAKILQFLPIGEFIKRPIDLLEVTGNMAGNYGTVDLEKNGPWRRHIKLDQMYYQDPNDTLHLLSEAYQQSAFESGGADRRFGPFVFIRALNDLLVERGKQPFEETLETVIALFNPLVFYLNNVDQGIPLITEQSKADKQQEA